MANARNINQIREELRQHAGRLETLAQALEGKSDAGAIVLILVESVTRGELWRRTANEALQNYINTQFETPHGYDPYDELTEECSCGHRRFKKK